MKTAFKITILLSLVVTIVFAASAVASAADPSATFANGPSVATPTKAEQAAFAYDIQVPTGSQYALDCALDSEALAPCTRGIGFYQNCPATTAPTMTCRDGVELSTGAEGTHTLSVRVQFCAPGGTSDWCDSYSHWHTGQTTTHSFVVDRTPPIATLTGGATLQIPGISRDPGIVVSLNEPGHGRCSTVHGLFSVPPYLKLCGSPYVTPDLSNDVYTFTLIPVDLAGNEGAMVSRQFAIDVFKPKRCSKSKSKSKKAIARHKKCVAANARAKALWKKRHGLK